MGSRGVLFAVDDDTTKQLLAARPDEAVMEIVEAIEEEWDEAFLEEPTRLGTRCTVHSATAGWTQLEEVSRSTGNPWREALAQRGAVHRRSSHQGRGSAVARALASNDDDGMRQRYRELAPRDYAAEYGDDDREHVVDYFRGVADFCARAAKAARAVIFTVDQ